MNFWNVVLFLATETSTTLLSEHICVCIVYKGHILVNLGQVEDKKS